MLGEEALSRLGTWQQLEGESTLSSFPEKSKGLPALSHTASFPPSSKDLLLSASLKCGRKIFSLLALASTFRLFHVGVFTEYVNRVIRLRLAGWQLAVNEEPLSKNRQSSGNPLTRKEPQPKGAERWAEVRTLSPVPFGVCTPSRI